MKCLLFYYHQCLFLIGTYLNMIFRLFCKYIPFMSIFDQVDIVIQSQKTYLFIIILLFWDIFSFVDHYFVCVIIVSAIFIYLIMFHPNAHRSHILYWSEFTF